jgi:hypothetical protein
LRTYRLEIAFDVFDVATPRAAWILTGFVNHIFNQPLPVENTAIHDLEADYFSALFKEVDGGGRHRSRKDTANIGVMSPGSCEEDDLFCVRVEDGGYDCDVWKMTDMGSEKWM